jgi:DNA-directed RNA polymerase specialized sigma24 family protein
MDRAETSPTSDDPVLANLVEQVQRGADETASAKFAARAFDLLLSDRRWVRADVRDPQLIEQAVVDAVASVLRRPETYDPARGPVLGYLRMSAHGDLVNLINRESRHTTRSFSLDAVELDLPAGNQDQEEPASLPDHLSVEDVVHAVRARFPDPLDRRAVMMMANGVRDVLPYARLYGVDHLSVAEYTRLVRRHKDRIARGLRRLGDQLRQGVEGSDGS